MLRVLVCVVLLAGCGAAPLGESWSMDWLGQCHGEMTDDAWTCGEQSGALARDGARIDFGVATATVSGSGDTLVGTVTTTAGPSCFLAHRH